MCPATRGALAAITHEEAIVTIADDETARRAWALLPRGQAAIDGLKAALDVYVSAKPLDLGDGKILCRVESSRRDIVVDGPDKVEALRSILGDHADEAVEMSYSASLTSIERASRSALAASGKKRGMAELRDRAVAALDLAGGVRVGSWTVTKVVQQKS